LAEMTGSSMNATAQKPCVESEDTNGK